VIKLGANIKNWIRNIEQHASENINKVLIGNKCDLVDKRIIDTARGKSLADEFKIPFYETSAKNSTNVDEAFISLARDVKKRLLDNAKPTVQEPGLSLKPHPSPAPTKKGCCS